MLLFLLDFYHQKNGNTPLHLAAKHGKTTIVKYLLEKEANKSAQNNVRNINHKFANNTVQHSFLLGYKQSWSCMVSTGWQDS